MPACPVHPPCGEAARKGRNGECPRAQFRQVQMGSVTATISCSFDRGTFGVLPLTYFYFPKSAMAYLFLQSVKMHYFCSGPIGVDPICPQPTSSSSSCGCCGCPTPRRPCCPSTAALPRASKSTASRLACPAEFHSDPVVLSYTYICSKLSRQHNN